MTCLCASSVAAGSSPAEDAFHFPVDTLAYANELTCEYHLDPSGTKMILTPRVPRPNYTLRCFVVTRTARQFLRHARFQPGEPKATPPEYRYLVRLILRRSPRTRQVDREPVVIPGYANLREFSREQESLLKAECGSAWQSYFQRGNWRMIFPFTRGHQERTADALVAALAQNYPPLVHVVCFPALTLNHVVLVYAAKQTGDTIQFEAYDPNRTDSPITLVFDRTERQFLFPPTPYFPGGPVNVYEIYRGSCY